MLELTDALELLRASTFRIRGQQSKSGLWRWGTAFFISPDGLALTAYHNLPHQVRESPETCLVGYQDGREIELQWIADESLPMVLGDIALLRLAGGSPGSHLKTQYVPRDYSWHHRIHYWLSRPVCIFGYPFEGVRTVERFLSGQLDPSQPLLNAAAMESGGAKPGVEGAAEWFRILGGDNAVQLGGISGAPILDRASGLVVGVQHSFAPPLKVVYGTELHWLAHRSALFRRAASVVPLEALPPVELAGVASTKRVDAAAIPKGVFPPLPRLVVGRDTTLSILRARLSALSDDGTRVHSITALHGWPGVGKTTTAAAIAHNPEVTEAFPDGVFWASLGQTPQIDSVLRTWYEAASQQRGADHLNEEELRARLTALFHDSRSLLIIDDVWDAAHAETLRVGGRRCASLITTREPGIARSVVARSQDVFVLPVLPDETALQLLFLRAPGEVLNHSEFAFDLVKELEGLPLAIHVAGYLLDAELRFGLSLPDLIQDLRSGKPLLNGPVPLDQAFSNHEMAITVTVLLRKTTDRLSPEDRMRFALLSILPPKPAKFDLSALAAVWDLEDPRPTVRTFVDRGLLEWLPGDRRYWMHAVLMLHAAELCSEFDAGENS